MLRQIGAAVERHRPRHRARPVLRARHDRRESLAVDVERDDGNDGPALGLRIAARALGGEPHQRREELARRDTLRGRAASRVTLRKPLLVDPKPLAVRRRQQHVAHAGRQIVAPFVDDRARCRRRCSRCGSCRRRPGIPRCDRASASRGRAPSRRARSAPAGGRCASSSNAGKPAVSRSSACTFTYRPNGFAGTSTLADERQHAGPEHDGASCPCRIGWRGS